MKKILFPVLTLFFLQTHAQITVTPLTSPAAIASVLSGGNMLISNLTMSADTNTIASFIETNTPLTMDSGLVLSNGDVFNVVGPNTHHCIYKNNHLPGDSDVAAVGGFSTVDSHDYTGIEFDCVPAGDTLYINYSYGSEEYMEYLSGGFYDVFGIFVSGPNVPFQNIAMLPNTQTPVTAQNVNLNTNSNYYFDNENPVGQTMELDGFVIKLTAKVVVVPNATYHIKIGIVDMLDGICDSDLFLEANSFSSASMTGVGLIDQDKSFSVFPVPASDVLNISTTTANKKIHAVIHSMNGQELIAKDLSVNDENISGIDISGLAEGIYFIELNSENSRSVKYFSVIKK
jgi:hypothetical protein